VLPLYARMQNPLTLDDPDMISWAREVFAGGSRQFPQLLPQNWVDDVRSEGYDSIIYKNTFEGMDAVTGKGADSLIVFDPSKIRSINAAFEQIRSAISLNSAKPALVVPAGEVVRAILEDAQTGVLKDYNTNNALSRSNFYIDNLHLGNLGAYAVALTHYATITKRSPVGLPNTAFDANFYNDNVVSFNPAVVARIQQIVWDVVSSYPNALAVNSSQAIPPWEPVIVVPPVTPPPPVEPDPPFVTESATPSDAVLLTFAFGSGSQGSPAVLSNLPKPVAAGAAGQFAMEYTINPVAETEGVVYTPHWSYDLKNWTITQPANTVISRTDNTVRIAWPNTSRWRFLRIHLAKPAQ
jgi:hypothetical protein